MGTMHKINNSIVNFPVLTAPKPTRMRKDPKYSVGIVFNSEDPQQTRELEALKSVISGVAQENEATLLPSIKPLKSNPKLIQVNATATPDYPPAVRDIANNAIDPMMVAQEIYSGAICNFMVDVYHTPTHGRICIGLLGVQKKADGKRLDNRPDAESLFDAEGEADQGYGYGYGGGDDPLA
jgi:hypothetical protein